MPAKRPERSQKTGKVHDDKIISMVKENNFTTSNPTSHPREHVSISREELKQPLYVSGDFEPLKMGNYV